MRRLSPCAAALFSIVVYSVGASWFGIPTSESHSLIAGLSGAAIAIHSGVDGINMDEWIKVIYGLFMSLLLGFACGWVICKLLAIACAGMNRHKDKPLFSGGGDLWRGSHELYARGPGWAEVYRRALSGNGLQQWPVQRQRGDYPGMADGTLQHGHGVGTSVGGEKIIKSVGMDMVHLEKYQGFARICRRPPACCSQVCWYPGLHTHTKTSAIMGVGAVKRLSAINFGVVKDMMLTWVSPSGLRAHQLVMAKLFMAIL